MDRGDLAYTWSPPGRTAPGSVTAVLCGVGISASHRSARVSPGHCDSCFLSGGEQVWGAGFLGETRAGKHTWGHPDGPFWQGLPESRTKLGREKGRRTPGGQRCVWPAGILGNVQGTASTCHSPQRPVTRDLQNHRQAPWGLLMCLHGSLSLSVLGNKDKEALGSQAWSHP